MFKKLTKIVVCAGLVTALALNFQQVNASSLSRIGGITIQSVNVNGYNVNISITGNGFTSMTAAIYGKAGTSRINLTMKLQKYEGGSWKNIRSWDTSSLSSFASLSQNCQLGAHGTYRCKLKASVWKGGVEEKISGASSSKSY